MAKIEKKLAELKSRFGGDPVYSKNKYIESFCLWVSRWNYAITKGLYFKIKFFLQRLFRGYDDLDKWNAGWYIARRAIPVLKAWRNGKIMGTSIVRHREDRFGNIVELDDKDIIIEEGAPLAFTEKEWRNVIDNIIFSFEFLIDEDNLASVKNYKSNYKRYKKGLKLFSIYLNCLWD